MLRIDPLLMRAFLLTLIVLCTALGWNCSHAGDSVFVELTLGSKTVYTNAVHLGHGDYITDVGCLRFLVPDKNDPSAPCLPVHPSEVAIQVYDPPNVDWVQMSADPLAYYNSLDPVGQGEISWFSPPGYLRITSEYESSSYQIRSDIFGGFCSYRGP